MRLSSCEEGGEKGKGCDGELAVLDGFEAGGGVGREALVEGEGHGDWSRVKCS